MSRSRIIKMIVSLVLVITMTFSLTSCLFDFQDYMDIIEGLVPDEDIGGGNGGGNGGGQTPTPDDSDENLSDNIGEFYPGSGVGSLEGASNLTNTLLSTVIVVSNFILTPAAGAGVIYQIDKESGDAYVITNHHVIYSEQQGVCQDITLYLYGMELSSYAVKATFLGGSVNYDIAVLKVSGSEVLKNSFARAAEIGDSEKVRVFDTVYAVGNPEGLGISATRGMVSVESENLELSGADGTTITIRAMRVDAAVNGGNSGGGLYDSEGKLVGIVNAKRVGGDVENMGYAIPSNLAKSLADNIIAHCNGKTVTQVNRPILGITITAYVTGLVIDPESGEPVRKELVEVTTVNAGSLAYGKIMVGDVVNSITLDGVTVEASHVYTIPELMLNARVGSVAVMHITRGETDMSISFTITEASITLEK